MVKKSNSTKQISQTTPTEIDFSLRVEIPDGVMIQELDGEAVILNLNSESYFGLDDVGTHMWTSLTKSTSIQTAFDSLTGEYNVEELTLRKDLIKLVLQLVDHGLLVLKNRDTV